jgi:hypothetical protein
LRLRVPFQLLRIPLPNALLVYGGGAAAARPSTLSSSSSPSPLPPSSAPPKLPPSESRLASGSVSELSAILLAAATRRDRCKAYRSAASRSRSSSSSSSRNSGRVPWKSGASSAAVIRDAKASWPKREPPPRPPPGWYGFPLYPRARNDRPAFCDGRDDHSGASRDWLLLTLSLLLSCGGCCPPKERRDWDCARNLDASSVGDQDSS